MAMYFKEQKLARQLDLGPMIDWVFPHACPLCSDENRRSDVLCVHCWSRLEILTEPKCVFCGLEVEGDQAKICQDCYDNPRSWDKGSSAVRYGGAAQTMVLRLKNMRAENLASVMAKIIFEECARQFDEAEMIVPMPLHWTKALKRGFNQAGLIGHHLSVLTGVPMVESVLKRTRATKAQMRLGNFEARRSNLENAIVLKHPERVAGKSVVIVDDVMTSGASLETASHALREGDVGTISVVAFARAG